MPNSAGAMSDTEVARFVEHYERLTRYILTEMPLRADLVTALEPDRSAIAVGWPLANAA